MTAARSTPSRPVRRVAAACLLAVATLLATPGPAVAWTDGPCPDGDGVTVVVDFEEFRDEVVVRCAPTAASGYEALEQVGLSYTPTARFPGFLCRIEGFPADDPCQNTPPPDAYWGYWRAEHGGSWTYSQYGPATTSPPPGPVEGWRFSTGDDAPPRSAPPGDPAPDPEPEPEPEPAEPEPSPEAEPDPTPATPSPVAPATTTSPPPPEDSPPADGGPDTPMTEEGDAPTSQADGPTTTRAHPTEDPAPGLTATPVAPTSSPTAADDAPTVDDAPSGTASAPRGDDGPPLGTLLGVGLVAIVGGGAVVVDRRRRQP